MVRRWRADLSKAAAIDGRMGRNSIHRKSSSKRDASTRLFYRCAQNGAGLPCDVYPSVAVMAPRSPARRPGGKATRQARLLNLNRRSMFAVIPGSSLFNGGTIMHFTRSEIWYVVMAAVIAIAGATYGQEKSTAGGNHGILRSADLKWTPIIQGCDLARVNGDSSVEGAPFVLRLRCAAGSRIPAHWHPTDENVTVLQGTFQVGMGEKFDATKLETMSSGNFVSMPKEMRHFALSKTATIVQVNAIGPFKMNWVDPSEVLPPDAKPEK
jgi:quercetin dioxygenase-like cupin family protein